MKVNMHEAKSQLSRLAELALQGRFLIAQAQAEGLALVTRDGRISAYGIRTMSA